MTVLAALYMIVPHDTRDATI